MRQEKEFIRYNFMRKFYVVYEYDLGEPKYGKTIITLLADEKANIETFNKKLLNRLGGVRKEVLSWSLIEDKHPYMVIECYDCHEVINFNEDDIIDGYYVVCPSCGTHLLLIQ